MTRAIADVAALLGSRICHDLISPIGAISNGVELLAMSGSGSIPEISLIAQSVEQANARIAYFRVAFGAASADQRMGAAEVRQILAALTQNGRLTLEWLIEDDTPRTEVKLAFLLINCLETAMPRGGTVTAARDGTRWRLTASSDRFRVEPGLWEALSRPGAGTTAAAAEVQFLLAPTVATELGRSLSMEIGQTGATIWF